MQELGVPKIIWMYWDQGRDKAPEMVRICLDSWISRNPGWDVRILDRGSWSAHVDHRSMASPEREDLGIPLWTDILRFNLLAEHGGIWIDASCLCAWSLDRWLPQVSGEGLLMFRDPGEDRIISTWFIAARPGNQLVTGFRDSFTDLTNNVVFTSQESKHGNPRIGRLKRQLRKRGRSPAWFGDPRVCARLKAHPYFLVHYHFEHYLSSNPMAATFPAVPRNWRLV